MKADKAYPKEVLNDDGSRHGESLSKRVAKGTFWVFSLRVTNRGLGFIRTIILARLLAPEDFGLLGIAMLAASTLDAFSQTGFQSALVQKKDNVEPYLDVAWTCLAVRGLLLSSILFLSAPLVADFFESPQAKWVIMVISFNMLLTGFGNIGTVFFQKDLHFNKQFIYEFSATIVDLAVSITLAFLLKNVWALVWGGLMKNIVRFFLSYILHPYRPKIRFEKNKFKELFSFGMWIFVSTVLIFLITQGDDIFVGKMLGVAALGFYQMAYLISNLPVTEISDVISRVSFPAYSKLQHDAVKLRAAYLKVLKLTAFISIPSAAGIIVLCPDFTRIFLGDKWLPIIPVIQVLALSGLVSAVTATARPILHGVGEPKFDTIWQVVKLLILVVVIYPLSLKWGISGVATAVLISTFLSAMGFNLKAIRITGCKLRSFGKVTLIPLINSLIMAFVITSMKPILACPPLAGFLLLIGAGSICYVMATLFFEKTADYGIVNIFRETYKSI